MVGADPDLRQAVGEEALATTNLWYARICKSAASRRDGATLRGWHSEERDALVAALIALPDDFEIIPMRALGWRMGKLVAQQGGLSTLGSEAVAAAEILGARLLVSSRDDSPGIRSCCTALGLRYSTLIR
jgi:hypothetical protein